MNFGKGNTLLGIFNFCQICRLLLKGAEWHTTDVGLYIALRILHHKHRTFRTQELCESRGGRPGLSVIMSLMVSVGVKQY